MEEDQGYLGDDDDFKPDPKRIYSSEVNHDNIKIGDRVKVNGGPGNSSAISEATILNSIMNGPDKRYYIHYAGSHIRFDEWVHKSYILAHRSCKQNKKEDIDKKNNTNEDKASFDTCHANSTMAMASCATSSRKRSSSSSSSSSSFNNLKTKKKSKKLNKSPKVSSTSQDSDTDSLNSQNANLNEIDKIFIQHQQFFSNSERNANYSKNILEINDTIATTNKSTLKQSLLSDLDKIKNSNDKKFAASVHTCSSSDEEIIRQNKKKVHQYRKNGDGTSDLNIPNTSGSKNTDSHIKHSHRSSIKWKHFPKYTPDPLCLQVDLKDEHDPDKRIKILTEKISQLKKDYMFLKEGVAKIKKARKKKLKKISRKQQSLSKNE